MGTFNPFPTLLVIWWTKGPDQRGFSGCNRGIGIQRRERRVVSQETGLDRSNGGEIFFFGRTIPGILIRGRQGLVFPYQNKTPLNVQFDDIPSSLRH